MSMADELIASGKRIRKIVKHLRKNKGRRFVLITENMMDFVFMCDINAYLDKVAGAHVTVCLRVTL